MDSSIVVGHKWERVEPYFPDWLSTQVRHLNCDSAFGANPPQRGLPRPVLPRSTTMSPDPQHNRGRFLYRHHSTVPLFFFVAACVGLLYKRRNNFLNLELESQEGKCAVVVRGVYRGSPKTTHQQQLSSMMSNFQFGDEHKCSSTRSL